MPLWALAALLAIGGAACGFAGNGLGTGETSGGGPDGGRSSDGQAANDAAGEMNGGDDAPASGDGGSCVLQSVPAGWTLVVESDASHTCPSGYAGGSFLAAPGAQPGACTCSCTVSPMPSCQVGQVQLWYGDGCQMGGFLLPANGGCYSPGGTFSVPTNLLGIASAPSGGACVSNGLPDPTKVTTTGIDVCTVPPSDQEAVCSGTVPQAFAACIRTNGDVACPAGPFTQKVSFSDQPPALACHCGACGFSATCSAHANLYSDSACGSIFTQFPLDGQCEPAQQAGSFQSGAYVATPQVSCTPGAPTASVAFATPQTLCCR